MICRGKMSILFVCRISAEAAGTGTEAQPVLARRLSRDSANQQNRHYTPTYHKDPPYVIPSVAYFKPGQ